MKVKRSVLFLSIALDLNIIGCGLMIYFCYTVIFFKGPLLITSILAFVLAIILGIIGGIFGRIGIIISEKYNFDHPLYLLIIITSFMAIFPNLIFVIFLF